MGDRRGQQAGAHDDRRCDKHGKAVDFDMMSSISRRTLAVPARPADRVY